MVDNPSQRATEVEAVARAIYACEGRSSFWALHYAYTLAHTAITALDAHRAGVGNREAIALDALESASAWLDRSATHVGSCRGDGQCTCGLVAIRAEAVRALALSQEPDNG